MLDRIIRDMAENKKDNILDKEIHHIKLGEKLKLYTTTFMYPPFHDFIVTKYDPGVIVNTETVKESDMEGGSSYIQRGLSLKIQVDIISG